MAEKRFSNEELNFFKFASIVYDEFPKMLRSTFVTLWNTRIAPLPDYPEWTDSPAVRNLLLRSEGDTTKIPVKDSIEKWDCTALFQATIYSKTFPAITISPSTKKPNPFHSSLISPTGNQDETIALAIDQIRLLRNTLCHSSKSSMTKKFFEYYVQLAKDAFHATGFSTSRIDDIGDLKEEDFPTEKVNELNKKIIADKEEINKILNENKFLRDKLEKGIRMLTDEHKTNKEFRAYIKQKIDKIEKNTNECGRTSIFIIICIDLPFRFEETLPPNNLSSNSLSV